MRRKNQPQIRPYFPILFWTECSLCEHEFKWEWGWVHDIDPRAEDKYFCSECAPTIEDAARAVRDRAWINDPSELSHYNSPTTSSQTRA